MKKIYPGKPWYDTNGNLIQAHGAQVVYREGKYYWYGENKELSKPGTGIWHNGVRCYSSDNLYDWKDEGLMLFASGDENSPLHPTRIIDRPHILYNERVKKYIMWIKLVGSVDKKDDWANQRAGIAIADSFLGPYTLVKDFKPNGKFMGDFDFIQAESSKDVYLYYGEIVGNPYHIVCTKLTDDYMDVEEEYKTYFHYASPPDTRESPAFFKFDDKIYLSTSGCTGYHPNPSSISVSRNADGPWEELGDICVGDETKSTFHSQISCVLKHPFKENLYIAIADRWLSDLDLKYLPWITEGYRILQSREKIETDLTWEEVRKYSKRDTSLATYVWLPFKFDENKRPYLSWEEEWSVENFD